jgi:hypothetical protein
MAVGLVEASLPGLQMATFLLCPHGPFLCLESAEGQSSPASSFSCNDWSPVGLEALHHIMTSFNLDPLRHHFGVGLQHINFQETQFSPSCQFMRKILRKIRIQGKFFNDGECLYPTVDFIGNAKTQELSP